jgi:hypothetical protein
MSLKSRQAAPAIKQQVYRARFPLRRERACLRRFDQFCCQCHIGATIERKICFNKAMI